MTVLWNEAQGVGCTCMAIFAARDFEANDRRVWETTTQSGGEMTAALSNGGPLLLGVDDVVRFRTLTTPVLEPVNDDQSLLVVHDEDGRQSAPIQMPLSIQGAR